MPPHLDHDWRVHISWGDWVSTSNMPHKERLWLQMQVMSHTRTQGVFGKFSPKGAPSASKTTASHYYIPNFSSFSTAFSTIWKCFNCFLHKNCSFRQSGKQWWYNTPLDCVTFAHLVLILFAKSSWSPPTQYLSHCGTKWTG